MEMTHCSMTEPQLVPALRTVLRSGTYPKHLVRNERAHATLDFWFLDSSFTRHLR